MALSKAEKSSSFSPTCILLAMMSNDKRDSRTIAATQSRLSNMKHLFRISFFAKCLRVGKDGPGPGHLCHIDTFLVLVH